MKTRTWWKVAAGMVAAAGLSAQVGFADTIWDYEAVNSLGYGTYSKVDADPTDANKVTFTGVVIGGTTDFTDPNAAFAMYSIWIQDPNSTKGGIQCWAGPWDKSGGWDAYPTLHGGELVQVSGWLANNNGKVFVNDRHSAALLWTVDMLNADYGMPTAQVIPSVSACNYFDATRAGGGELYQTRWVDLNNVEIVSGTWGAGNSVTISDGTGELTMLLSGMGDFNSFSAPVGKFNVTGVFDQEDTNNDGDYQDMYRLWVKDDADITAVPEPATMTLVLAGISGLSLLRRRTS